MSVYDIFSKRERRLRGNFPDVYSYNELPNALKVQITHIIKDACGVDSNGEIILRQACDMTNHILCREYGVFALSEYKNAEDSVIDFFLRERSIDRALDVVEILFLYIDKEIRKYSHYYRHPKIRPDEPINALNLRFKEHGVGFQFESPAIIRIDSDFIHAEAIKPALFLLRQDLYQGANEEFLNAHQHYRHGRYKECLVDALKAFESTLKAICAKRGWETRPPGTAKALINTCIQEGLFPEFLESQMGSIRSLLESGVPTVRNKLGGHGQGTEPVDVPEYFARYALNLAATSILFVAEADQAKG